MALSLLLSLLRRVRVARGYSYSKEQTMKKHTVLGATALGACVLASFPAQAQNQTVITTPPAQQQAPATVVAPVTTQPAHETAAAGPNGLLLHSGLFAFGVPYIASIVVASSSDRSEDKNLYIPV